MSTIYRVQHDDGRGPFRPGFSKYWADTEFMDDVKPLPTFMVEFGEDVIEKYGFDHEHFGSGVHDLQDIKNWFSNSERMLLQYFGFSIVKMNCVRIIKSSENQIFFGRSKPLNKDIIVVPWDDVL